MIVFRYDPEENNCLCRQVYKKHTRMKFPELACERLHAVFGSNKADIIQITAEDLRVNRV